MVKNKEIISKLNRLDKEELNIIARKLEIKEESKLPSIFQKKQDIIEHILNRCEEKALDEILTIISILKSSDNEWFKNLANDLGLKISSEKKIKDSGKLEYVKKILDKSEYTRLVKKIIPEKLGELTRAGLTITFLLLLLPSTFALFAAIVSIIALIFTLFAYAYPDKTALGKYVTYTHKEEVISRIISTIIALLFVSIYFSYPYEDQPLIKDSFLYDWGNMATVIGCFLAFLFYNYERSALINWWKKHNVKVMMGVIFISLSIFIYVKIFTVAGTVWKGGNQISGAEINLKEIYDFQSWICYDLCKNEENWLCKYIIKTEKNSFGKVKTDSGGRFYIRVLSFSKENVKIQACYNDEKSDYDESLNDGWSGNKKIKITLYSLNGCWKCNDGSSDRYWQIKQEEEEEKITITNNKNKDEKIEDCSIYGTFSYDKDKDGNIIADTGCDKIKTIKIEENEDIVIKLLNPAGSPIHTFNCNKKEDNLCQ